MGWHERALFWVASALGQDMFIYWLLHKLIGQQLPAPQRILLGLAAGLLLGCGVTALAWWTPRWRTAESPHVAAVWRCATWFLLAIGSLMMLAIDPLTGAVCLALVVTGVGPYLVREVGLRRALRRVERGRPVRRGSIHRLPRQYRRVPGVSGAPPVPADRAEFGDGT